MEVANLTRADTSIVDQLMERGDQLITTKTISIHIPEHYVHGELGSQGDDIRIVGIFGIVMGNEWSVSSANALMPITPSSTTTYMVKSVKYLQFNFQPGEVVCPNLNLVKFGTLVYRIYKEIIAAGKIPWYLDENDLAMLFDTALLHGGANLKSNPALLELIIAHIARMANNLSKFFRHRGNVTSKEKPVCIPLSNVGYGATNTTAKLAGNLFAEGVTSALVTPSTSTEEIETILRG